MSGSELFNHHPSGAVYSTEPEIDYEKEKIAMMEMKIARLEKEVKDLKDKNSDMDWQLNPDRMGK